jgi:hypothetical protein
MAEKSEGSFERLASIKYVTGEKFTVEIIT